jgi:hypothetical protein
VPRTSDEYRTGGVPKRAYVDQGSADDVCILVDRPWPRSVRKQDLARDAWPKDVAPSGDLRAQYGHRRERFEGLPAATAGSCDRAHRLTHSPLSAPRSVADRRREDAVTRPGEGTRATREQRARDRDVQSHCTGPTCRLR